MVPIGDEAGCAERGDAQLALRPSGTWHVVEIAGADLLFNCVVVQFFSPFRLYFALNFIVEVEMES